MTDNDQDLVDALDDIEAGLTAWELEFTESITERVDAGVPLTDGQREKAEEILRRLGR